MAPTTKSRMERALSERMYFMGRAAASTDSSASFIVTGQSGKVWTVSLPRKGASAGASSSRMSRFHCNCPDQIFRKGTCKHMLFVCLRVLKFSTEQLAGLESGGELDMGFLHEALEKVAPEVDEEYCAPAALKARLKAIAGDFEADGTEQVPKVEPRMPEEDEACPICYEALLDGAPLIHCDYGCGKPVHVECFERYKKAHNQRFGRSEIGDTKLRCVTCRMDWTIEPKNNIVGKRGMLVGRRAIDLAQAMPEVFTQPTTSSRSQSSKSSKSSKASKSKMSKKGRSAATTSEVRGGRVTKTKTEGGRKSARIASNNSPAEAQGTAPISKRKAPRKAALRMAKKKAPATKKASSGWSNAIEKPDPAARERASSARSARAARRGAGSTRRTRSQRA